jgi:hypothetical protein
MSNRTINVSTSVNPLAVVILVIVGNDLTSLYSDFPSQATHGTGVGDATDFVEVRCHGIARRWQGILW